MTKGESGGFQFGFGQWVRELQIPVRLRSEQALGYPRFPVELSGFREMHAPFRKRKAHTLPCPVPRGRKSGYARDDKGESGWFWAALSRLLRNSIVLDRIGGEKPATDPSRVSDSTS